MTPELKQRWIEALESGKYVHGKGKLHDLHKNTHCCLGVLCDVAGVKMIPFSKFEEGLFNNQVEVDGVVRGYQYFENELDFGELHTSKLWSINDHPDTEDYTKQIQYIKDNL